LFAAGEYCSASYTCSSFLLFSSLAGWLAGQHSFFYVKMIILFDFAGRTRKKNPYGTRLLTKTKIVKELKM
jgi:hypothetical protein